MPQPILSVPPFPNVPAVPGVPALLRPAAGAVNVLTGALSGAYDSRTGQFTGAVQGLLLLSSGEAGPLLGTLRGVIDGNLNFAGLLSGGIAGRAVGTFAGIINSAGVIQGTIQSVVSQLTGNVAGFAQQDAANGALATEPFVWGIFDSSGSAVVVADSVAAVDTMQEQRIPAYPVEQGAFQSFNKVEVPFDVRLTLTKGGTVAERTAFLASLDAALASLDLYDVNTPEKTYTSVNVVMVSQRRTAQKGATMLTVDVGVQQVRATAQTAFTRTLDPAGAATTNTGAVQPATPPATVPDPPGAQ